MATRTQAAGLACCPRLPRGCQLSPMRAHEPPPRRDTRQARARGWGHSSAHYGDVASSPPPPTLACAGCWPPGRRACPHIDAEHNCTRSHPARCLMVRGRRIAGRTLIEAVHPRSEALRAARTRARARSLAHPPSSCQPYTGCLRLQDGVRASNCVWRTSDTVMLMWPGGLCMKHVDGLASTPRQQACSRGPSLSRPAGCHCLHPYTAITDRLAGQRPDEAVADDSARRSCERRHLSEDGSADHTEGAPTI